MKARLFNHRFEILKDEIYIEYNIIEVLRNIFRWRAFDEFIDRVA